MFLRRRGKVIYKIESQTGQLRFKQFVEINESLWTPNRTMFSINTSCKKFEMSRQYKFPLDCVYKD